MSFLILAAAAATFTCSAPRAVDGDTLRCAGNGRVRLLHIDAPELEGHCRRGRRCTPGDAEASRDNLARLIRGRQVTCQREGIDRYGRILARCSAGGIDLACAQVSGRYAVERYGRLSCREARKGLQ